MLTLLKRCARRGTVALITLPLAVASSGCRDHDRPKSESSSRTTSSRSWFTDITQESGLDFVHDSGATGELLLPEIMGGGSAFLDFDNDGDLDIYLINGSCPTCTDSQGKPLANGLFRQEPGGRFVNATVASGLGDRGYGMGVAVGDIDNDGDVDVYVTNYGPDALYRNRGDGTFENVTRAAGIDVAGWSASASFLDYDRDGFLDLYVTQYLDYTPSKKCRDNVGRPQYCGPESFEGVPDVLLHNNGDGTFTDVSAASGVHGVAQAGLGVVSADLDGDGWIDIYVTNDADANQLWINQKDGTFRDEAMTFGVAFNMHGQTEAGMGVVSADFDGDGRLDLFMTHMRHETNTLYRNLGANMGFDDVTATAGLGASSMAYTGFGTAAFDVELDGDLDILVVNGRVNGVDPLPGSRLPSPWDRYGELNLFYLNDGGGHFTLSNAVVPELCEPMEISRGLAVGDIDDDGDLDVLLSNIQGAARLYRNDSPRNGHWLTVRCRDPRLKRDALGAEVTVSCSGRLFRRTIHGGSSYLSNSDPRAHFGLGDCTQVDDVIVRWPDGLEERFGAAPSDRELLLLRGARVRGE